MRLRPTVIVAPTLLALLTLAFARPAAAQTPSIFVIAESDGYGVGDCLAEGGACGKIVADAWCAAHGAAHAVSFGLATVPDNQAAARITQGSLMISCSE